jgi:Fasciclin domain
LLWVAAEFVLQSLQAAGLAGTLSNSSLTATIFAPTDTAFAALATKLGLTPSQLLASPDLAQVWFCLSVCLCVLLFVRPLFERMKARPGVVHKKICHSLHTTNGLVQGW